MTEGSLLAALLRLAAPVIVSLALQTAYQLVNAFWVGRLGAEAVAAIAVTSPLIFLLVAAGSGLTIAGSVFVSQYSGAGNVRMVNHSAAQTILMVASVSLVLTVAGYLSAESVLRFMQVGPEVLDDAAAYLKISYVGLLVSYGFMVFQSILQGVGEVRFPLYVVAASVVLNAVLDPLLIFGWGPIPPMGVVGAAVATVISQTFTALIGVGILFTGRYGIHLRLRDFSPDFPFIKRVLSVGLPASIEQSTRVLGSVLLTALAAGFGTTSLAAYGLATRIITVFFVPALGFSSATATIVGQNIGAGKTQRAEEAARVSSWFAFASLTAAGLLFMPFAESLARVLVPTDEEVVALGTAFVLVVAPSLGIIGAQQALAGAFRGAGQTMTAMLLSLMLQWLFQLPLSYWLAKHTSLGFEGIWWGFPAANILALVVTIFWFRRGTWKQRKLTEEQRLKAQVAEEAQVEEGAS